MNGMIVIDRNEDKEIVVPISNGDELWIKEMAKMLLPYLKKDIAEGKFKP